MPSSHHSLEDAAAASRDAVDVWATRVLQGQAQLKAPVTLEDRVLAAIAATAAKPWWQQPFLRWPLPARLAFTVLSLACIWLGLAVTGSAVELVGGIEGARQATAAMPGYGWARAVFDTLSILGGAARTLAGSLPHPWLYGSLLLVACLYGSFFGLGAVGYRAFHRSR